MQKIKLGKTDLLVTKIGMGGIPIQRLSEEEAVTVIRHALDQGINWIDTANAYGPSEGMIGRAIGKYNRKEIMIFSKTLGRTPDIVKKHFESSLKKLKTDYIDIYQFHLVPDAETLDAMRGNGSLEFLEEMKSLGKIGHIGGSAHAKEAALALASHPDIETVQYPFNFIVEKEGLEVISECRKNGKGFIAMKPLGGGMIGEADVCIRFQLQFPDVAADPGFESIEEVDQVMSLVKEARPLDSGDLQKIERLKKELGDRFCRRCGYCMPCEQGVNIPNLMCMESFIKRFSRDEVVKGWIGASARTIKNCQKCGECEPRCPYGLNIMERIHDAYEEFAALEREI